MDSRTSARLEARARLIKALAHPTRLFIVEQLSEGEECVCRLAVLVGADISTVSRHLSLLKSAGIVHDDKRGTQVFYRLTMPCVLHFLGCVESMLKTAAEEQMSLVT
ncbi:MAG: metalloregulator ArsR/SmtB family transcription factor [Candidatus Latescibacterota bacterium]